MANEQQVISIPLDELTLEQLVQISQGLGREIDRLRDQRAYLRRKIDARLAAGERTSTEQSAGDATAPGATIEPAIAG